MTLLERIPTLSDEEVINLLTNARRLSEGGDDKQKAAAAELLPRLEEEAEPAWSGPRPSAPPRAARARPRPNAAAW